MEKEENAATFISTGSEARSEKQMKYSGLPMGMWLLLKGSFEKNLTNDLGLTKEEAKLVRVKAKPEYRRIIEKIPEFEKEDRFKTNIVNCAMLISFLTYLPEKIAERETEGTIEFLNQCLMFIGKPENISDVLISRISIFVVNTAFESFLEGNSEEETIRQTQLATEFCVTGLKKVIGI